MTEPRRSTLALLLLALLAEAPMHPYRMLGTIRERGQDQAERAGREDGRDPVAVVAVRRGRLVFGAHGAGGGAAEGASS